MTERETIIEIMSHPQHIAAQKLILIALLLRPEGLSLYGLMDILHRGKSNNRRVVQRQLEYLLATGAVLKDPHETRGVKSHAINYRLGVKT